MRVEGKEMIMQKIYLMPFSSKSVLVNFVLPEVAKTQEMAKICMNAGLKRGKDFWRSTSK